MDTEQNEQRRGCTSASNTSKSNNAARKNAPAGSGGVSPAVSADAQGALFEAPAPGSQGSAEQVRGNQQSPALDGWVPAFPGQRPPFQPGHTLTLTYGAHSPRKVDPLAAELVERLLSDDDTAYLRAPRYAAAVWAWARAEARVQLVDEWVSRMGVEQAGDSGKGKVSPLELLRKWEATATTQRSRLGLDPTSAARLGKDVAQGRAADAAAELTKMREDHERAQRLARGGDDD